MIRCERHLYGIYFETYKGGDDPKYHGGNYFRLKNFLEIFRDMGGRVPAHFCPGRRSNGEAVSSDSGRYVWQGNLYKHWKEQACVGAVITAAGAQEGSIL